MKILKKIKASVGKIGKTCYKSCGDQRGSTIIELLISLAIVGLIVTAVAVAGTYSIKNTGEARFKQAATSLAQEVIEKSRIEKNRLGFISFGLAVGTDTYCFDEVPEFFDPDAGPTGTPPMPSSGVCGTGDVVSMAGSEFTREVVFTTGASIIEVEVNVSWNDGGNIRSVQLIQEFVEPNQDY
jgi:prepilin-type N-terminal cleavage/methylation domain-containing protein